MSDEEDLKQAFEEVYAQGVGTGIDTAILYLYNQGYTDTANVLQEWRQGMPHDEIKRKMREDGGSEKGGETEGTPRADPGSEGGA